MTSHDHAHAKPAQTGCSGCCGHDQPAARDTAVRPAPAPAPHPGHDHAHDSHAAAAPAASADAAVRARASGRTRLRIAQMDCPTEERMIRARLGNADGVVALDFNLLERHLTIHHTVDDVTPFLEALRAIGMDGEVLEAHDRAAAGPAAA
ncbi:4-deoxy-4-formamido-L-arabinose-phospho-UDP deformylase, partial [Ralstonia solanacearum]